MKEINILGYLIFAITTSITPGPNNIMLFGLGKSQGFWKTIPAMAGIFIGFTILLTLCGYGLSAIMMKSHVIEMSLKVIASLWLIYLAFMLRNISMVPTSSTGTKIGFFMAMMMQFVNPKAWIMGVNGAAAFLPKFSNMHLNVALFDAIFVIVGIPCMFIWVLVGDYLSKIMNNDKQNKIVGNILFVLMLLTVITLYL